MKSYTPAAKPVHLVKNFDEVPMKKKAWPMIAQEKHDGCYAYMVCLEDEVGIYSRTGQTVFSLDHLKEDAAAIFKLYGPMVIIFEVMAYDTDGIRWPVNEISGAFRRESEQFTQAVGVIHDMIPFEAFNAGFCGVAYGHRIAEVEMLSWLRLKHFRIVVSQTVRDEEEAVQLAADFISKGSEGVVLKQSTATWEAGKKDYRMMKIKQELSFDLRVIGVRRGKDKYADTLGVLEVAFKRHGKKNGERVVVTCSGMTDEQRRCWWKFPTTILGKIVKVDGMCLTPDGMIREPRFKEVRSDKEVSDVE